MIEEGAIRKSARAYRRGQQALGLVQMDEETGPFVPYFQGSLGVVKCRPEVFQEVDRCPRRGCSDASRLRSGAKWRIGKMWRYLSIVVILFAFAPSALPAQDDAAPEPWVPERPWEVIDIASRDRHQRHHEAHSSRRRA